MKNYWLVRADSGGRLAADFFSLGLVAVGWGDVGPDLGGLQKREAFIQRVEETYPEDSRRKAISAASQLFRFYREMKVGDGVLSYDGSRRVYLVGTLAADAQWAPDSLDGFPNVRKVEWRGEVPRDVLSVSSKNSLGSVLTLFLVQPEIATEVEALLGGKRPPSEPAEIVDEGELLRDLQSRSLEFIKDRISRLDWEQLQDLVAGLLRAMGYKTRVSPSGPDRGKDIVASPDGFGFESPRVIVEVKHRKGQMGAPDVRGLNGVLRHAADKGLFVSTGGFSKEAYYEAERAQNPLTLMDLDDLVQAIIEHYETMDMETRVLLPLAKIFWPV